MSSLVKAVAVSIGWLCAQSAGGSIIGIEVLHSVDLPAQAQGKPVQEISGLAWDADEQQLYAVSDRGRLYHFKLEIAADRIVRLEPRFQTRIECCQDPALRNLRNAESLALSAADNGRRGDSELLVAFEDGPAIARYSPAGELRGLLPLMAPLDDRQRYSTENNRIEAIAVSARHGLIAAAEEPLVGQDLLSHSLYASRGSEWQISRDVKLNLKAIEVLPDGSLLLLERRKTADLEFSPVLRTFASQSCAPAAPCRLADLPVIAGSLPSGSFEGMAQLGSDRFLIVSDSKVKQDATQPGPGKLVLLRLIRSSGRSSGRNP